MEILAVSIVGFCAIIGLTTLTIGTIVLTREMFGKEIE